MRPLALATALVLLGGPARAEPEDALAEPVRALYLDAVQAEARGNRSRAEAGLRAVRRADPAFFPALLGLARLAQDRGATAEALALLAEAPFDAEANEARGRLLFEEGRFAEAAEAFAAWQRLAPELATPTLWEAAAIVEAEPQRSLALVEAWWDAPSTSEAPPPAPLLHIAERRARAGDLDGALALLDASAARWEALAGPSAALRDELELEAAARALAFAHPDPLTPELRRELAAARQLLAAGDAPGAAMIVEAALQTHPRSPEALGLSAEVAAHLGRWTEVERALAEARRLEPLEPAWEARLGDALVAGWGGAADADAARAYARALRLRPTWTALYERRARALQRSGAFPEAERAWQQALDRGVAVDLARDALADLRRPRGALSPGEPGPACGAALPEADCLRLQRARVLAARGRLDEAEAALAALRAAHPDHVPALNLAAHLAVERGDTLAARAIFLQSVELDPQQIGAIEWIAESEASPVAAAAWWERAAALGSPNARVRLAQAAWDRGAILEARAQLAAWRALGGGGLWADEAEDLSARLRRVEVALGAVGAALALGAAAGGLGAWRRRRASVDLAGWVARRPASHRELREVLATLGHEVLRHEWSALEGVAAALEAGDDEPAAWLAARCVAPDGGPARVDAGVARLVRLAQSEGWRLEVARDPILGPLQALGAELRALAPALDRGDRAVSTALRGLAERLRSEAAPRLRDFVHASAHTALDRAFWEAAWGEVERERLAAGRPHTTLLLHLPDEPVEVAGWPDDLAVVAVNLLRNAAGAADGAGGRVGVHVRSEVDPATFRLEAVLRVADDAAGAPDLSLPRPPDRGLGLVLDRARALGATVGVEAAADLGLRKCVAVRLAAWEET